MNFELLLPLSFEVINAMQYSTVQHEHSTMLFNTVQTRERPETTHPPASLGNFRVSRVGDRDSKIEGGTSMFRVKKSRVESRGSKVEAEVHLKMELHSDDFMMLAL